MSELQFDEPVTQRTDLYKNGSKIGAWLIKKGFVSTEASANLVQVVFAVLFIVVSILVFVLGQPKKREVLNPVIFSPETTFEERRNLLQNLPRDQFIPLAESNEN